MASTIIFILLVIGFVIKRYEPKPVISEMKNIRIFQVTYPGIKISVHEDKENFYMTTNIPIDPSGIILEESDLFGLLSKYNAIRGSIGHFPYQRDGHEIEINIVENNRPKQILLSTSFSVWYESADKAAFDIVDAQKLKDELKHLIDQAVLAKSIQ
jgi:hypothetical protein